MGLMMAHKGDPIPSRYALFWLLGSLLLLLAPNLLRLPIWLALFCLAALIWRALKDYRAWPMPSRRVKNLLTLLVVVLIGLKYHSLFGREAGLALLSAMLCLKLLELDSLRDAMVIIFIGFFLEVASFLYSQSIAVGAYLLLVVCALTVTLLALNHPGAALRHTRRYLKSSAQLVLLALPLMLVLFVLFPRLSQPLWGLPSDAFSAQTGLSDHMNLGSISNLSESEAVAFRVDFQGEPPPAGQLYWRGPVLWQTDGRRWQMAGPALRQRLESHPVRYQGLGEAIEYQLTLEPHNQRWIFALDLPARLPPQTRLLGDFQLLARNRINQRSRYSLSSYPDYQALELDEQQWIEALQLPESGNPRSRALLQDWLAEGLDDRQLVERALALFRDEPFYYTRQPPLLGAEAVDEFLFNSRRGFCEHYAASFTFMMRLAGIPARVVTGYQGGETNPVGGYLIIRQSDAHAWSEVYLEGRGWVRVDPTAQIPPSRVQAAPDQLRFSNTADSLTARDIPLLGHMLRQLRRNWDALNHRWNLWVIGYNQDRQQRLMQALGLDQLGWRGLGLLMAAALGAALSIALLVLFWPKKVPIDPVSREYRRFCRKFRKIGLVRHPNEGAEDFAQRILEQEPALHVPVERITGLYHELRYGDVHDPARLEALRQAVRALRIKPPASQP